MLIVQILAFVAMFVGVMVGIGALTSMYPAVVHGWIVQALWGVGILFAGWVAISLK
jgi:hypothetical protein